MRRTALALAVVLVASFGFAIPAGATASILIDPSTGLAPGQLVTVSGTGFAPNASLVSAECKAGALSITDCDTGNLASLNADATGAYSYTFAVRTALFTANGVVDCTIADNTCAIGVADASDIPGTAVTAPISFAPLAPPRPGTLHVPAAPAGADAYLSIYATDFAPNTTIAAGLCAPGATDANNCGAITFTVADESGALNLSVLVERTLVTQNGESIDCTVDGACVYAAWDTRDFAASISTAPVRIAPEIAGTLEVVPSTKVRDGQPVTVSGAGWPAQVNLELFECDGVSARAACMNAQFAPTNDDGTLLTPYVAHSVSRGGEPQVDCETGPCWVVARWYLAEGATVQAAARISFDTTPVAVTSHYTAAELAAVDGAASTLAITSSEVQHLGSWGLAWVLGITGTGVITPAPDSGPQTLTTNWAPGEYSAVLSLAAAHGTTIAEFQKTGALFLAYVLALS